MRLWGVVLVAMLLAYCGDPSSKMTLSGVLQAVQQGILVPIDPLPLVTVVGRNADEFELALQATTASAQVSFELKNVPKDQSLVFQTSGATLETVLSFPIDTSAATPAKLPVLTAGSTGTFIQLAEDNAGINITVNTAFGIVAGVIAPEIGSSAVSVGGAVNSVRILPKNADTAVGYQGPYYFNSVGALVDSGSCPDAECNYIFFDVPEGIYRFQKLDASNVVLSTQDVVVLDSQMTFGIE